MVFGFVQRNPGTRAGDRCEPFDVAQGVRKIVRVEQHVGQQRAVVHFDGKTGFRSKIRRACPVGQEVQNRSLGTVGHGGANFAQDVLGQSDLVQNPGRMVGMLGQG